MLKSVTVAVGNANDEAEDDDGDAGDEGPIDIGPKDLKSGHSEWEFRVKVDFLVGFSLSVLFTGNVSNNRILPFWVP